MIPIFKNRTGPGVRNWLKGVKGRWSSAYELTRDGMDRRLVHTFTSVLSGHRPHQSDREINRRLRQAARKAQAA